jgi:ABC-type Mn2+/Zn2+ transport system permease subunit
MNKVHYIFCVFILVVVFAHYSFSQNNLANIFTPQVLSTGTVLVNHSGRTQYQLKLKAIIIDSTLIAQNTSFYLICGRPDKSESIISVDSTVNVIANWYELYFSIVSPKGWMDVVLSRDTIHADRDMKTIPISNKQSVSLE